MKIDVNNVSLETTQDDLRKVFEPFGEVTSILSFIGPSGELMGLIEMPTATAAMMAIINLNGKELKGQRMQVHQAAGSHQGAGGLRKRPIRNKVLRKVQQGIPFQESERC